MKRPTARELNAAADAILKAHPAPPEPEPDCTNVTPFRRRSALDWLEHPARGESRLTELRLLAADVFTRDHNDGSTSSPAEQTVRGGLLVLYGEADDIGYRCWQTERRRERFALRVHERERRGELNLLTVNPTGNPGGSENNAEGRLLARAWRKAALRKRLGAKDYGVLDVRLDRLIVSNMTNELAEIAVNGAIGKAFEIWRVDHPTQYRHKRLDHLATATDQFKNVGTVQVNGINVSLSDAVINAASEALRERFIKMAEGSH